MNRKDILHRVVQASEAIRYKHRLLKHDKASVEMSMNEVFKPIIEPLQKISNNQQQQQQQQRQILLPNKKAKKEDKNNVNDSDNYDEDDNEGDNVSDDFLSLDGTLPKINTSIITSSPAPYGATTTSTISNDTLAKYINLLGQRSNSKTFDTEYGVRKLMSGLHIGNAPISFNDDSVIVNGINYKRTPGLIELLFKKIPNNFVIREEDIKNYRKIVSLTLADRKHYRSDTSIRESKDWKYTQFILDNSKLKRGDGIYNKIQKKIDYIHWNNPNELVDRLRLILASQAAGNNNHTNEINSIIEELKEANIIY